MKKGKLTISCTCGNERKFTFTVERPFESGPGIYTFYVICPKCNAKKQVGDGVSL